MGENAVSKENMLDSSNTVTTGRVSIDIQKLRSPQKGEVNIKIIPQGDTI